jgi:hypothetical protein
VLRHGPAAAREGHAARASCAARPLVLLGADVTTLRAHWPLVASLVLGVAIGWILFHPRQAAVHENVDERAQVTTATAVEQREDVGGWSRTTYEMANSAAVQPEGAVRYGPSIPPTGTVTSSVAPAVPETGQLLRVIVERHDPTVIATHATEQVEAEQDRHLELTVSPPTQPGWAVQVGVEGLEARTLRLAARRRLFGPFWVELSAVPISRSVGVAAAVEW